VGRPELIFGHFLAGLIWLQDRVPLFYAACSDCYTCLTPALEGATAVPEAEPAPLSELSERDLVERAKTDEAAFGELYARYGEKIYSYIYYRTSNYHDAEDLTARVFHRALRHIPNYEDRGLPFSAWLYRIAHNLVVNWHRDTSRRTFLPLDDLVLRAASRQAPEAVVERHDEADQLLRIVHEMPEDRQQLLVLKFVDRLSNAEIGEIMGRSEGAIKSLYHRTLLALREEVLGNPETTGGEEDGHSPLSSDGD
jgi:RNA polymerase sigma-70 factor (ECF subfamily)